MTLETIERYDTDSVSRRDGQAIVVGGSMAGLLAARVLADRFERVTVLERDALADDPEQRRGVPQGHHVHVLLEAGRATLEDLFPGYGEDLLSAGGLHVDAGTDLNLYAQGGYLAAPSNRVDIYSASRPLLEHTVRRHVRACDNVEIRPGYHVSSYLSGPGESVAGVKARTGTGITRMDADLVVDATGRTSSTPNWLEEHGYSLPPVDEVRVDVTYSSILVDRPRGDRRMYFIPPEPPRTRGGGAFPIEDERWLVTLLGVHGDEPPATVRESIEFAGSLPTPELKRLLEDHPIRSGQVRQYPLPSNLRRRYEALEDFPDGLLVIGDAIASFNPIHGQGMSVAALEALQLHHALRRFDTPLRRGKTRRQSELPPLAADFFEHAGAVTDRAWQLSVGSDFRFQQTTGPKPRGTALFNRYIERLVRKAQSDGSLTRDLFRVTHMETTPSTLFRPGVFRRVLTPF